MLFTSIPFVVFLFVIFILYWFVLNRNLKVQNFFLLVSSYFFYGWWDWRFLFLLFFISVSNYIIAILIQKKDQNSHRKFLFILGLIINIGTLVIFKYFNFFADGLIHLISLSGIKTSLKTLNIILPIGISFYIFISLSYIIDVYQHKLIAVRNLFDALLTFSFFPIILAGPIQRPISLLPQIQTRRIFNYSHATDGLRQILWGVFMKIVIADRCAVNVNAIFSDSSTQLGSTLILGIFLFTVQIYADFAGYSNIAIGLGKLLGFNIMQNFAYPYFSRDIRAFWKRWNISLTSWFRDYVFLPIAYSVSRNIKSERFYLIKTEFLIYAIGLSVTWVLTGLWHGANYTFIIWGAIQGFFLLIFHITIKPKKRLLKRLNLNNNNVILIFIETIATFIIIMFSWTFFRADNIGHALSYISGIFSMSSFTIPVINPITTFLIVAFFVIEYLGRDQEYAIARLWMNWYKPIRWAMYYTIIFIIIYFMGEEQQFIYFQF
ncbi:MAG: MBOAT family protein [Bacteroidales bacterium]|nr:MBOAT family protein [Bacteroidales bacterium]